MTTRQHRPAMSKKEQFIIKRLKRTRKLFAFLRLRRHELFDDKFQQELEGMYRDTGAGDDPLPPALLCMALLLQGYHRISDAESVELTVMDLRWQMVLGCLGADEPAFAQGTLQAFRERLIAAEMDRRLLERTKSRPRSRAPKATRSGAGQSSPTDRWAFACSATAGRSPRSASRATSRPTCAPLRG